MTKAQSVLAETYLAEFQRCFPLLTEAERIETVQTVRDSLEPVVGPQEAILASVSLGFDQLREQLVTSLLYCSRENLKAQLAELRKRLSKAKDGERIGLMLVNAYFLSAGSARKMIGSKNINAIEEKAEHLLYSATQLSLIFFSGTSKVDKHAH